jgi:hypothetical protein
MAILHSDFTDSSLAISHNAIKSILFRCAELLLAYTVFKIFSLLAAKAKAFTSYLMFNEDHIQKSIYVIGQRGSRNSFLVLGFTIAYSLAQLYGTLLWGLDSPGYVERSKNITAAALNSSLLADPGYIVTLTMRPDQFSTLENTLPQIIGNNLYKAGVNFTLTGDVDRGTAEVTPATRPEVGPRIWLDDEGFSVSPDTYVNVIYQKDTAGNITGPNDCPTQIMSPNSWAWNCTFTNGYADPMLLYPLGRPEVHYDDASDKNLSSKYVRPNRQRNIWASYGQGGGTVAMKQMFTVTKSNRRHTFIETVSKFSMVSSQDFARTEVLDFVKRTWSSDPEEQKAPLIGSLTDSIMRAQAGGYSYIYGSSGQTNTSVVQANWEFLTPESNGTEIYSIVRISAVNITLIRSETLPKSIVPLESCDNSFQNEAEGGRVIDTDCGGNEVGRKNWGFLGQVDTSAVLIAYGLGDGRSNISSTALDQSTFVWLQKNSDRMDELLVARGFIVSVDPALVTLETSYLTPAISYLQLFLILMAVVLAPIGWFSLQALASPYWANSLLSNMLYTVRAPTTPTTKGPGYIWRAPDIRLWDTPSQGAITVDSAYLKLEGAQAAYASGHSSGYVAVPAATTSYAGYEPKMAEMATEELRVEHVGQRY